MLKRPVSPIRCSECPSEEVRPRLVETAGGERVVESFTCVLCGARWMSYETPVPAGPDYRDAYGGAPPLGEEEVTVGMWREGIIARAEAASAGDGAPVDRGGLRLYLLRQAAFADRAAREWELAVYTEEMPAEEAAQAGGTADETAAALLQLDLETGSLHVEGLHGPGSPEWGTAGGLRAYVRQEYRAWRALEDR